MEQFVITITRQFGSMGRPIARQLSELLGIEYYDRDIVDMVAKETNLPVSTISDVEEKSFGKWDFMKYPLGKSPAAMQNQVFEIQKKIILELAEKQSCIIVGRCAESILSEKKNLMSVYIYAPWEARYDNCINELRMNPKEAAKMIHDVDLARDAYHMKYAGYHPDDVNHQDFLVNSAFLGIEGTAKLLAEIVKNKYGVE